MQQRIYIDTSVVGGYFDKEFESDTMPFFDSVCKGEWIIVVSEILEEELLYAPLHVRNLLSAIPPSFIEYVKLTPESILLADQYIASNVVGKTSLKDCRHIALATTCNADFLVSWNFKHIVNDTRIAGYNEINIQRGYRSIKIITPKQLPDYGHHQ
jgi:predicted nucleic acid-binding protein